MSTAMNVATARPAGSGAAHAGLRLTRRGRVVLVLLAATLLLCVFSLGRVALWASTGGEPAAPSVPVADQVVVVHPGETLWQIAQRSAPAVDPRVTVARIVELNALSGASVRSGQELLLPS